MGWDWESTWCCQRVKSSLHVITRVVKIKKKIGITKVCPDVRVTNKEVRLCRSSPEERITLQRMKADRQLAANKGDREKPEAENLLIQVPRPRVGWHNEGAKQPTFLLMIRLGNLVCGLCQTFTKLPKKHNWDTTSKVGNVIQFIFSRSKATLGKGGMGRGT